MHCSMQMPRRLCKSLKLSLLFLKKMIDGVKRKFFLRMSSKTTEWQAGLRLYSNILFREKNVDWVAIWRTPSIYAWSLNAWSLSKGIKKIFRISFPRRNTFTIVLGLCRFRFHGMGLFPSVPKARETAPTFGQKLIFAAAFHNMLKAIQPTALSNFLASRPTISARGSKETSRSGLIAITSKTSLRPQYRCRGWFKQCTYLGSRPCTFERLTHSPLTHFESTPKHFKVKYYLVW